MVIIFSFRVPSKRLDERRIDRPHTSDERTSFRNLRHLQRKVTSLLQLEIRTNNFPLFFFGFLRIPLPYLVVLSTVQCFPSTVTPRGTDKRFVKDSLKITFQSVFVLFPFSFVTIKCVISLILTTVNFPFYLTSQNCHDYTPPKTHTHLSLFLESIFTDSLNSFTLLGVFHLYNINFSKSILSGPKRFFIVVEDKGVRLGICKVSK